MKVSRIPLGWLAALGLGLAASPASAGWVETHVTADDVRIEIDRGGSASIDHAITMQVKGGPLRSFDLALADADVTPFEGTVISAQTEGLLSSFDLSMSRYEILGFLDRAQRVLQFSNGIPQPALRRLHGHIRDARNLLDGQARFLAQQKCLALFLRERRDGREQCRLLFDEFRELVGPLMLGNFRFEQLRVRVMRRHRAPQIQIAPKKIDGTVVCNVK